MKTIAGYTDHISVEPGMTISFKVSCEGGPPDYEASLVRLICNDAHPQGPGVIEKSVKSSLDGPYHGRKQDIHIGSWALIERRPILDTLTSFTVQAIIWPTKPGQGAQTIMSTWSPDTCCGFSFELNSAGALTLLLNDRNAAVSSLSTDVSLMAHEWALVGASYDVASGETRLIQQPLREYPWTQHGAVTSTRLLAGLKASGTGPLSIGARRIGKGRLLPVVDRHFNGKIDSPRLTGRVLNVEEINTLKGREFPAGLSEGLIGAWDFSSDISSESVMDLSPNGLSGRTINLPARAMKGWNWSGKWHDWKQAPQEYGAIHFHDDDLADAQWETDFSLIIPEDLPSGVYAARLENGFDPEHIVFFVRSPKRKRGSAACFLASTATYTAYANYRVMNRSNLYEMYLGQLPELVASDLFLNDRPSYGDSLYATHSDGSGVSISSRLRPIVNMRPNTTLSAFNDDGFLLAWLDAINQPIDVITDEDLHNEGAQALQGYRVVLSGNHPEYWSSNMWDGLSTFISSGGRLMYLGGNGFYWRIAYHPTIPGAIELRRAEDGSRPWDAQPGEYYMSFNGEYGGMWRRTDRTPNELVGIGFAASGFDVGSYYRRTPASFDARAAFIFKGIPDDELIGDFGLVGHGAAGQEIDRYDRLLGSPPHALVVARSEDHTYNMMITKEELPATNYLIGGPDNPLVHADMTFFEAKNGGAVFSVGSISWSASLPYNNFQNNVATITRNVLERFLDPTPFPA